MSRKQKAKPTHGFGSERISFEILRVVVIGMAVLNTVYLVKSAGVEHNGSSVLTDLIVLLPLNIILTIAYLVVGFKADSAATAVAAQEKDEDGEQPKIWGLALLMLAIAMVIANWAVFPFKSLG